MSKVAVVYWSGTGNTEEMANAVANGAKSAGAEVDLFEASAFDAAKMDEYDAFAFGCPAMGDEILEEDVFEPLFTACEDKLAGKKTGLFGSYGWGDGAWMQDWQKRCEEKQAALVSEGVICMETPDDDAKAACEELGKKLA